MSSIPSPCMIYGDFGNFRSQSTTTSSHSMLHGESDDAWLRFMGWVLQVKRINLGNFTPFDVLVFGSYLWWWGVMNDGGKSCVASFILLVKAMVCRQTGTVYTPLVTTTCYIVILAISTNRAQHIIHWLPSSSLRDKKEWLSRLPFILASLIFKYFYSTFDLICVA